MAATEVTQHIMFYAIGYRVHAAKSIAYP